VAYIASNQRAELAQSLSPMPGVLCNPLSRAQRSGRDLVEFEDKSLLRTYGRGMCRKELIRPKWADVFLEAVAEFGHSRWHEEVVSKG